MSPRYAVLLICCVLLLSIPNAARAQPDDTTLPPTDFGAGYKIVSFEQYQEHDPAPGDDPYGMGPVTLNLSYPLIHSPRTSAAKDYNNMITQLSAKWWKDIGGPKDNSQSADPDTDIWLVCTPVGDPTDYGQPPEDQMLPGVISMSCAASAQSHEAAAASGGFEWGYNWLVAQHRPIQPEDIFAPNSGWLKALTALVEADRSGKASWAGKLDVSDRHHWVLGTDGLGVAYSNSDFLGYWSPCEGCLDVIPWSKLISYLRKGGIVPQSDWSATFSIHYK